MKQKVILFLILIAMSGCAQKDRKPEPLDNNMIRDLIVGKTLVIQNRRSGKLYEAVYHENGQRTLRNMNEQQVGQSSGTAPYEIKDGKIITTFDGVPFGVMVYKIDGKYVASRIGEGGTMNWELIERN